MNVGSRNASALVAVAVLSLASVAPALAVSQSSGLMIRITRPSAATINLVPDPLNANGLSGSLTPTDSRGSAGICAAATALDVVPAVSDCLTWAGGVSVAFTLPLDELTRGQSGLDIVATAS